MGEGDGNSLLSSIQTSAIFMSRNAHVIHISLTYANSDSKAPPKHKIRMELCITDASNIFTMRWLPMSESRVTLHNGNGCHKTTPISILVTWNSLLVCKFVWHNTLMVSNTSHNKNHKSIYKKCRFLQESLSLSFRLPSPFIFCSKKLRSVPFWLNSHSLNRNGKLDYDWLNNSGK